MAEQNDQPARTEEVLATPNNTLPKTSNQDSSQQSLFDNMPDCDEMDPNVKQGIELANKVEVKYRPVFESLPPTKRAALAWYFLPHRSKKATIGVTRPRILKWYCPFANQNDFPSGHRYCINVYAGCGHQCEYCYAAGYEPEQPHCKKDFERGLLHDLANLEKHNVPPAPVHLSNSTDPFQPIEQTVGQTLFSLRQILNHRHRFTSVVLLTKNPSIALQSKYLDILQQLSVLDNNHPAKEQFRKNNLPGLRLEISLAFWRQEPCQAFDVDAPSVEDRIQAIRQLSSEGIPIVLRIDPLLPRNPLPNNRSLSDFHLPQTQTLQDLEQLVNLAAEIKALHIVYSVAKIIQPRFKPISTTMKNLKSVYEYIAQPDRLIFRGGSWRLPSHIAQQQIIDPFLNICQKHRIKAFFCKQNLVNTP
ncbi:MAG: hypothetical protein JW936_05685 [Sedimentisphaerales bacterium]|nr:hypothetical protein [Sedimentisphaerales bacterium]